MQVAEELVRMLGGDAEAATKLTQATLHNLSTSGHSEKEYVEAALKAMNTGGTETLRQLGSILGYGERWVPFVKRHLLKFGINLDSSSLDEVSHSLQSTAAVASGFWNGINAGVRKMPAKEIVLNLMAKMWGLDEATDLKLTPKFPNIKKTESSDDGDEYEFSGGERRGVANISFFSVPPDSQLMKMVSDTIAKTAFAGDANLEAMLADAIEVTAMGPTNPVGLMSRYAKVHKVFQDTSTAEFSALQSLFTSMHGVAYLKHVHYDPAACKQVLEALKANPPSSWITVLKEREIPFNAPNLEASPGFPFADRKLGEVLSPLMERVDAIYDDCQTMKMKHVRAKYPEVYVMQGRAKNERNDVPRLPFGDADFDSTEAMHDCLNPENKRLGDFPVRLYSATSKTATLAWVLLSSALDQNSARATKASDIDELRRRLDTTIVPLKGTSIAGGRFDLTNRRLLCEAPFAHHKSALAHFSDNIEATFTTTAEFRQPTSKMAFGPNSGPVTFDGDDCVIPVGTRVMVMYDVSKYEATHRSNLSDALFDAFNEFAGIEAIAPRIWTYVRRAVKPYVCHSMIALYDRMFNCEYLATGSPLTFLLNDFKSFVVLKAFTQQFAAQVAAGAWKVTDMLDIFAQFGASLKVDRITVLPTDGAPLLSGNGPLGSGQGPVLSDLLGMGWWRINRPSPYGGTQMIPCLMPERWAAAAAFPKRNVKDDSERAELRTSKVISLYLLGGYSFKAWQTVAQTLFNSFKQAKKSKGAMLDLDLQDLSDIAGEVTLSVEHLLSLNGALSVLAHPSSPWSPEGVEPEIFDHLFRSVESFPTTSQRPDDNAPDSPASIMAIASHVIARMKKKTAPGQWQGRTFVPNEAVVQKVVDKAQGRVTANPETIRSRATFAVWKIGAAATVPPRRKLKLEGSSVAQLPERFRKLKIALPNRLAEERRLALLPTGVPSAEPLGTAIVTFLALPHLNPAVKRNGSARAVMLFRVATVVAKSNQKRQARYLKAIGRLQPDDFEIVQLPTPVILSWLTAGTLPKGTALTSSLLWTLCVYSVLWRTRQLYFRRPAVLANVPEKEFDLVVPSGWRQQPSVEAAAIVAWIDSLPLKDRKSVV